MADPHLFVDPRMAEYLPCATGVELRMSIGDKAKYMGTAKRINATGQDAPDRVALESEQAPQGFTLYKQSHDDAPATNFKSRLRLNMSFPPGGHKFPVTITCAVSNGVTIVTVDPIAAPANP